MREERRRPPGRLLHQLVRRRRAGAGGVAGGTRRRRPLDRGRHLAVLVHHGLDDADVARLALGGGGGGGGGAGRRRRLLLLGVVRDQALRRLAQTHQRRHQQVLAA